MAPALRDGVGIEAVCFMVAGFDMSQSQASFNGLVTCQVEYDIHITS